MVLLLGVKVGQDVRINAQDSQLKQMSDKIESYEGLSELLTVQKQLSDLQTISDNKKMLSRVFTVLYSIVHSTRNGDTVNISTLDVNLETSDLDFDGQANAGSQTDGVDFRVLESFKKTIELMKYDYGRYVDKDGNEIPTMCIFEANTNGSPYTDDNGIYAIWAKGVSGCDPSKIDSGSPSESSSESSDGSSSDVSGTSALQLANIDLSQGCSGEGLVCIYRTPQKKWYESEGSYMSDDGTITNIEHFESRCISYSVTEDRRLTSTNSCDMSPDGLEVINSTNGKAAGGELVLMFSAVLHVNPEVFSFANKHMITITPSGRQNVTDSYMQVGDMFAEKAKAVGTEN